jgi:hypothetical protein
MAYLSIRDLQKISADAIGALPGPTPVKSGNRTVGLLVPLKAADLDQGPTRRQMMRLSPPSARLILSIGPSPQSANS